MVKNLQKELLKIKILFLLILFIGKLTAQKPLDSCACKTLSNLYELWKIDPANGFMGSNGNFDTFVYKLTGNMEFNYGLAQSICNSALWDGKDWNNKDNTLKWNDISNERLKENSDTSILKIPKSWACSNLEIRKKGNYDPFLIWQIFNYWSGNNRLELFELFGNISSKELYFAMLEASQINFEKKHAKNQQINALLIELSQLYNIAFNDKLKLNQWLEKGLIALDLHIGKCFKGIDELNIGDNKSSVALQENELVELFLNKQFGRLDSIKNLYYKLNKYSCMDFNNLPLSFYYKNKYLGIPKDLNYSAKDTGQMRHILTLLNTLNTKPELEYLISKKIILNGAPIRSSRRGYARINQFIQTYFNQNNPVYYECESKNLNSGVDIKISDSLGKGFLVTIEKPEDKARWAFSNWIKISQPRFISSLSYENKNYWLADVVINMPYRCVQVERDYTNPHNFLSSVTAYFYDTFTVLISIKKIEPTNIKQQRKANKANNFTSWYKDYRRIMRSNIAN